MSDGMSELVLFLFAAAWVWVPAYLGYRSGRSGRRR